jgi:hypothetical protein
MKRVGSSIVVFCVFVWLLPLGAFIKPTQEKKACDGRRAFHMCSMMSGKTSAEPSSEKVSISNSSGFNENAQSQGSGGNEFLIASFPQWPLLRSQKSSVLVQRVFQAVVFTPSDPPPKISPLF